MRSRGLVVAIAVVLAVLAAVGVIVYTSSVRENATNENSTQLVTSSQDIAANTPLDPLIASGVFKLTAIPNDAVVGNHSARRVFSSRSAIVFKARSHQGETRNVVCWLGPAAVAVECI